MEIWPAIDLYNGNCVRLQQGDYDRDTVFSDNPGAMAKRWFDEGATCLHCVDLDGARSGSIINESAIQNIVAAAEGRPVQLGGGVRNMNTIEQYITAGLTYIIIGTKAVEEPDFVAEACREFAGHIIVGIDAKDGMVATHGWANVTDTKATELAKRFADVGVSSIVYTDIARDGMMQGVNVEQTVNLAREGGLPVIASGGVTDMKDIELLKPYGDCIEGIITGRAIYEGTLNLSEAQLYLDS